MSPATSLALGFALILAGFLVPFLMVLQIVESGLALSVSAYCASLVGLVCRFTEFLTIAAHEKGMMGDRARLRQQVNKDSQVVKVW